MLRHLLIPFSTHKRSIHFYALPSWSFIRILWLTYERWCKTIHTTTTRQWGNFLIWKCILDFWLYGHSCFCKLYIHIRHNCVFIHSLMGLFVVCHDERVFKTDDKPLWAKYNHIKLKAIVNASNNEWKYSLICLKIKE